MSQFLPDQGYGMMSEPGYGPAGKDTGSHPNQPALETYDLDVGHWIWNQET